MGELLAKDLTGRLEACRSLPTLPGVAVQLIALCQQKNADFSALEQLIAKDPALAAKVLHIVNSPLYGVSREITSLHRAVSLLGLSAVRTIALSLSLVRAGRATNRIRFDYTAYWQRSLISALAAAKLCHQSEASNTEEYFLAALLQDIGMLALAEVEADYGWILDEANSDHVRLQELEQKRFGVDHSLVSAWLLDRWGLPVVYREAARGSHQPSQVGSPEWSHLIQCTACSGLIADLWVTDRVSERAVQLAAIKAGEWLNLSRESLAEVVAEITAELPEISKLFEISMHNGEALDSVLTAARETLLQVGLEVAALARKQEDAMASLTSEKRVLEEESSRDGLTGLPNRGFLLRELARQFERAETRNTHLSVAFCDIDHFKHINDNWGHLAGDEVLREVSEVLQDSIREGDLAARYGGDEFLLILSGADASLAQMIGERLRESVDTATFQSRTTETISVQISVGVAFSSSEIGKPEELVAAADAALYQAKRKGRNRVVIWDPSLLFGHGTEDAYTRGNPAPSRFGDSTDAAPSGQD